MEKRRHLIQSRLDKLRGGDDEVIIRTRIPNSADIADGYDPDEVIISLGVRMYIRGEKYGAYLYLADDPDCFAGFNAEQFQYLKHDLKQRMLKDCPSAA